MRELGYISPREVYRRRANASIHPLTLGALPHVTFYSDLPESGQPRFMGQDIHHADRVAIGLFILCMENLEGVFKLKQSKREWRQAG